MRLSKHFELSEFTRTRAPLDNAPMSWHILRLGYLSRRLLQPWRDAVGRLYITSGFRTHAVNAWLNENGWPTSPTSEHMLGLAADVRPLDTSLGEAWYRLLELDVKIGQAILYVRAPGKGWIHVSVDIQPPVRRDIRVDVPGQERTVPWSAYNGPLQLAA